MDQQSQPSNILDNIMNFSIGEKSSKLEVSFKKTVLIRDYETEVIESATCVELDKPINGIERMFVSAILCAQMEYTCYINLRTKGLITETEFNNRKTSIEQELCTLKSKAETLLGAGAVDKYMIKI